MGRAIRYARLPTEQSNPHSRGLDHLSPDALLQLMNREDRLAVRAVGAQRSNIARAIRLMAQSIRRGGRVFFVGAGTSGRLGVLEAAECPPTFSTSPSMIQAVMAGGRGAVFRSREGAEDRRADVRRTMRRLARRGDVVIGIAASGVTPFVDAALRAGTRLGAATILLTCHPRTATPATIRIVTAVGPEVLTGSTRLKAGTATKLVLNRLTLGAMAQLGKIYGNLMVDVRPSSAKLRARALRIIRLLTGCSAPSARATLRAARGRVPVAVLMKRWGVSYDEARRRLSQADGSLRQALSARAPHDT
jgi:N-acetylmuramic acid 6-phosphate etherase